MITIELMGGLGNQLFQIFTVLGYSFENNIPYFFQDKGLQHGWRKKVYWDTILSSLKSSLDTKPINTILREPHFGYVHIPPVSNDVDTKLFGYFQSYKYFDKYKTQITELLDLESKKESVRGKLNYDFENTISMHFRIGDYKNLEDHHPIMKPEYYIQSISKLCELLQRDNWTVMYVCESEDISTVNETIEQLQDQFPNIVFDRCEESLDDWEQMLAMSLCHHHIIANSSFSWFGAYFNTRESKQVCYPSIWFGPSQGSKDLSDLFPTEWNKI